LHESDEVWEVPSTTLAGFNEQDSPADEIESEMETMPVNPFSGETVTVDPAAAPARLETLVGVAEMLKSGGVD
jgi:hypothetical protein